MDKNWVRERGRRARRRRCWWGGGRRTVARAGRVSVFLVLSCWWGPRHSPAEQRRGARDKGLICGGAHSYSHLYCQCVAVALIILVSLDYHIHVTFYLGNDGVMTRCLFWSPIPRAMNSTKSDFLRAWTLKRNTYWWIRIIQATRDLPLINGLKFKGHWY